MHGGRHDECGAAGKLYLSVVLFVGNIVRQNNDQTFFPMLSKRGRRRFPTTHPPTLAPAPCTPRYGGQYCGVTPRRVETLGAVQFRNDSEFMENIMANTGRYSKLFSEAIDQISPEPSGDMDQASGGYFFLFFCQSSLLESSSSRGIVGT